MENKADSLAHGKANPCGHSACIFVGEAAGCIDSRLILPKLNLATLNWYLMEIRRVCMILSMSPSQL